MFSTNDLTKVYTPEQVAEILQLSKNTIYQLLNRGEIVAKKFGKVYRIPASSLSFMFTTETSIESLGKNKFDRVKWLEELLSIKETWDLSDDIKQSRRETEKKLRKNSL